MGRTKVNNDKHPLSPRQKRLQLSIWAAVIGGACIGFAVGLFEGDAASGVHDAVAQFSQGPLDPAIALVITILSLILVCVSTYFYHKNADEHEERAILWGSTIGAYATVTLGFAWMILNKGAILPEPSVLGLLGILCLSSFGPYLWLKYR